MKPTSPTTPPGPRYIVYDLPAQFAGGAFFIGWRGKKFGVKNVDDYFGVIDSIRPLLEHRDFKDCTIGFYLNRIGQSDDVAVRLNYYSVNVPDTIRVVEAFVNSSSNLAIHNGEHANRDKPIADYNDGTPAAELAFKNFLDANSRICLDLLQGLGTEPTRDLIHGYIWKDLPQGRRPEQVLDGTFALHSGTYRGLTQRGVARRYWDDLLRWHRPDSVGMHFMCNMLVLADPAYGHPAIRSMFSGPLNTP